MLTDQEIVAVMRDGNNCNYNDEAEHIDFARAVIAAHEAKAAPAVPQGWRLVPVEPTREMLMAALDSDNASYDNHQYVLTEQWKAMLAATPAAPSQPVTLTEREVGDCIDKTNRESPYGTHHFGWSKDLAANIIAALREKEGV